MLSPLFILLISIAGFFAQAQARKANCRPRNPKNFASLCWELEVQHRR